MEAELEQNYQQQLRLKKEELKLVERRKTITTQLATADEVDAPPYTYVVGSGF